MGTKDLEIQIKNSVHIFISMLHFIFVSTFNVHYCSSFRQTTSTLRYILSLANLLSECYHTSWDLSII